MHPVKPGFDIFSLNIFEMALCFFLFYLMYIHNLFFSSHMSVITFVTICPLPPQHQEFSFLLKERVCPLVIKLFSPNIKFRQGSSSSAASPAPVEKPYFPICMRLLRVVSVLIKHFYSLLVSNVSTLHYVTFPQDFI